VNIENRVQEVFKAWREDRRQDPILMYLRRVDDGLSWLGELAHNGKVEFSALLADIGALRQLVRNDALSYDEAAEISTLTRATLKNRASELRKQGIIMPRGRIHLSRIPLKPGLEFLAHSSSGEAHQAVSAPPPDRSKTQAAVNDDFDSSGFAKHLTRSR
jgi:hypothetical protein